LQHLHKLRVLWLNSSRVDDSGVASLSHMRSLERLHLSGTKLSPDGRAALQRALPQTNITYE
jgi:hypothetical protein